MPRPTKPSPSQTPFAKRLAAARLLSGHTSQVGFARKLGIEAETYRQYERGVNEPNLATLAKIREFTGQSLDLLICGKPASDDAKSTSNKDVVAFRSR